MTTHLGGDHFVADARFCNSSAGKDWLYTQQKEGELRSRLAKLRHQLANNIFPTANGMNDDEVRAAIAKEITALEQQITPPK